MVGSKQHGWHGKPRVPVPRPLQLLLPSGILLGANGHLCPSSADHSQVEAFPAEKLKCDALCLKAAAMMVPGFNIKLLCDGPAARLSENLLCMRRSWVTVRKQAPACSFIKTQLLCPAVSRHCQVTSDALFT